MNKETFIEHITQSELDSARKEQILALLREDQGFSFETQERIKDIIREDILADTKNMLSTEDMTQTHAMSDELLSELSEIEGELHADMAIVDTEMGNLDAALQQANKVLDTAEIEKFNGNIAQ